MKSALHTHVTSVLAEMFESRNFNGVAVNWNQAASDEHTIEAVSPNSDHTFNIGVSSARINVKIGDTEIPTANFGLEVEELSIKNIDSFAQAVSDISACMGIGIPAASFVINTKSGNAVMYHPYDVEEVNKLRDLIARAIAAGCPLSKEQIKVMLGNMRESSSTILRNYLLGLRIRDTSVDDYMSAANTTAIINVIESGGGDPTGVTHLFTLCSEKAERITTESADAQEVETALTESRAMAEGADDAFALVPLSALFTFKARRQMHIALMVRQTVNNGVFFGAFLVMEDDETEDAFDAHEYVRHLTSCYDHLGDFIEIEDEEDEEGQSPDYYSHWTTTLIDITHDRTTAISQYIISLLNGTDNLGGAHSEYIKSNRSNITQARYRTGAMTAIHNAAGK